MTGGQLAPDHAARAADHHQPGGARPDHGPAAQDGGADRPARRAGLRGAGGALRREAAAPRGEGHREVARAPGPRRRLLVRRGALRVPGPPARHPAGGGALRAGADAAGLPARREEGRRRGESWASAWRTPVFEADALLGAIGARGEAGAALLPGVPARARSATTSGSSWRAPGATAPRPPPCWWRARRSTRGFDATHIPSYGPESRGGTSYADVRIAAGEVLSPDVTAPHALVAFNAPSLARFGPAVAPGGVVLYDPAVVREPPRAPRGRPRARPRRSPRSPPRSATRS